jgi:hypothetical protein
MTGITTTTGMKPTLGGPPVELPTGAFLGKSIGAAIKLYLGAIRRKQTTKEIAVALKEGGVESTSDNFESVVLASLAAFPARPSGLQRHGATLLGRHCVEPPLSPDFASSASNLSHVRGHGGLRRWRFSACDYLLHGVVRSLVDVSARSLLKPLWHSRSIACDNTRRQQLRKRN